MGILQKFYALISKGPPADPNQPVELIVVSGPSGPMTLATLREHGFTATGHETYNVLSRTTTNFRILVPRHKPFCLVSTLFWKNRAGDVKQ